MMPSTTEEDPFLQVQQDVLSQLQSTRSLFTSYLRIRSLAAATSTSTSSARNPSPELASARADVEAALATLADDVADLTEAVRAVEGSPARFGLDGAEVARRRRLVVEVGGETADMREELAREAASLSFTPAAAAAAASAPASGSAQARRANYNSHNSHNSHNNMMMPEDDPLLPDPSSFAVADGSGGGDWEGGRGGSADYAAEFAQQQQLALMREQDEHLDGVAATVGNLRIQAGVLGLELEEQVEMLDEVDGLADRVGGRLKTGAARLRAFSRQNEDRLSSCCIAVLVFVLILLLVLLLVL